MSAHAGRTSLRGLDVLETFRRAGKPLTAAASLRYLETKYIESA